MKQKNIDKNYPSNTIGKLPHFDGTQFEWRNKSNKSGLYQEYFSTDSEEFHHSKGKNDATYFKTMSHNQRNNEKDGGYNYMEHTKWRFNNT